MPVSLKSLPQRRICTEALAITGPQSLGECGATAPYRAGTSHRFSLPPDRGVGYEDLVRIGEGLYLMVCHRKLAVDEPMNFIGEGVLKLHFRLCGNTRIVLPDGEVHEISGPQCGVMLHPQGVDKAEFNIVGIEQKWVTLFCTPRLLSESLRLDSDGLPVPFRRFLYGDAFDLFSVPMALTPAMGRAVMDLFGPGPTGSLRSVYAEGKCLELVATVFGALQQTPRAAGSLAPLTKRELDCVQEARQIVEREFAEAPSLHALARRVGINQNKLNQGFRQLFEHTVGEYMNECRMRHAEDLLRSGSWTVAQVAYEVGYDFPGNFTTAFKRFYGTLPRSSRKELR
ncbi:MAG: AraC family transcriptional regulator [Gammaproteobacteria bacterium]|nr:AraC family transcriptional regulator [Gammaproteobacteria bacterium]